MRPRSNSLPAKKKQKMDEAIGVVGKHFDFDEEKIQLKPDLVRLARGSSTMSSQFSSFSACSSPVTERRVITDRRGSEKISKKKLIMSDLKAFVEMKLLSKSDKMLEKAGVGDKGEQTV